MRGTADDSKANIHLKGGFSERNGIVSLSKVIQDKSLNLRTINRLYNLLSDLIQQSFSACTRVKYKGQDVHNLNCLVVHIYTDLMSMKVDDLPIQRHSGAGLWLNTQKVESDLHSILEFGSLSETFDLIEGVAQHLSSSYGTNHPRLHQFYTREINRLFEEESVTFTLLNGQIIPNVSPEEKIDIEQALDRKDTSSIHLSNALKFLYDREDPQYGNSIKESISSVEAAYRKLTGQKDISVADGITHLKRNGFYIHPALEKSINALFGYASDRSAVRHAAKYGEPIVNQAEARFALVWCAALINYIQTFQS